MTLRRELYDQVEHFALQLYKAMPETRARALELVRQRFPDAEDEIAEPDYVLDLAEGVVRCLRKLEWDRERGGRALDRPRSLGM